MKIPFSEVSQSRKLESAITVTVLLFIFKILFYSSASFTLIFINEILVFGTLYLWMLYVLDFIRTKISSPLPIILNTGILTALIFFILAISAAAFEESPLSGEENFVTSFFSLIISFVFLGASIYIFTTFRELFFLRQKRDPSTYYNTMIVFFILVYFSNLLIKIDPNFDYPKNAFYVVSLIIISVNSLRVAWIAFLVKKQKIYLLILSIILSVLFGFNFGLTMEGNTLTGMLVDFSPGFHSLLNLLMIYGTIYFGVIFFTTLFHLPTAEAFDRKAQEVTSLMDLTKLMTQVLDFKELAKSITEITTKVSNSDSAWLVIDNEGELDLAAVHNIGYVEAGNLSKEILKDKEGLIDSLISFNPGSYNVSIGNDLRKFKFSWIVIAPLSIHDKRKGYLFAARKKDFSFDDDDKKSVEAFSNYASVALENAKLIEESIEKERLEKELDVARDIQYKILPAGTPKADKMEISALFVPAFEVGGDYYDFFKIDENNLGFVIADVSGKGISAAFIMAEIKGIFESLARTSKSPKEVLTKANEILNHSLDKKNFVTAIYGIINIEKNKLTFARSGHSPLILIRNGKAERFAPPGLGLGLDEGSKFSDILKEMEIDLNNNDILALYTDGVIESQNAELEDFGYDRFEKILIDNSQAETDLISNKIMEKLTTYSQANIQHDDITLVIFKMKFNNKTSGDT